MAVVVVDIDVVVVVAVVAVVSVVVIRVVVVVIAVVVVVVLYHIEKGCPHPALPPAIAVRAAVTFALQQPPECVLSPPPQNERWSLLSPSMLS